MVWYFMKTREDQNKILQVGMKDFHIVTNILHVHIKHNAVIKTEFEEEMNAMKKAVAAAVVMSHAACKRTDLAKTTTDAMTKKKRRRRGDEQRR